MAWMFAKTRMVEHDDALPGRADAMPLPTVHAVFSTPFPHVPGPHEHQAIFAMGCFWGAERLFWQLHGVVATAVGYAGGFTPNPTYEEVCSGRTGHAECVLVTYDSRRTSFAALVSAFFEGHDPTQWMRQGNDVGTQYRSAIYARDDDALTVATEAATRYGERLRAAGFGDVVTEIRLASALATPDPFYYAEGYHQQYLAKHPDGYCGLGTTGVSCPVGLFSAPRGS